MSPRLTFTQFSKPLLIRNTVQIQEESPTEVMKRRQGTAPLKPTQMGTHKPRVPQQAVMSPQDMQIQQLGILLLSSQLLEPMCHLLWCTTLPQLTKDRAPVKTLSNLVPKKVSPRSSEHLADGVSSPKC